MKRKRLAPISRPLYTLLTRDAVIAWAHGQTNAIVGYAGKCSECPITTYILSASTDIVHCIVTVRDIYVVRDYGMTERIKTPSWLALVIANVDALFAYGQKVKGEQLSGLVKDISTNFPSYYYVWNDNEITCLVG